MTTWTDALVATANAADLPPDRMVDPAGIETPTAYWTTVEARDYLEGENPRGFLLDPPHYRVDKATGKAEAVPWPDALAAMNADDAVRVGDWTAWPGE